MKRIVIVCAFALTGCGTKAYKQHITNEEIIRKTEYCRQHNTVPRIQYDNGSDLNIADIVCIPPEAMN